jgi:hypothetical protein
VENNSDFLKIINTGENLKYISLCFLGLRMKKFEIVTWIDLEGPVLLEKYT